MRYQSTCFLFFSILFQIIAQSEKEQFRSHVPFPSGQKSAKAEIVFQQSKRTLYLDRTAKPQINAFLCGDVRLGSGALFPVLLSHTELFGLVFVHCFAALITPRTAGAILTAVIADDGVMFAVLVPTFTEQ